MSVQNGFRNNSDHPDHSDDAFETDGDRSGATGGNSGGYTPQDDYIETAQFELADDDERLPWLESDYDDENTGVDTGRLIGFALLSLVGLAIILGAAWYLLRDTPNPDLQPEGTLIAAPQTPVKVRPRDAGGKTFEGTGNVAPTVGEGQSTEGRLSADDAARPSIDLDSADRDSTGPVTAGTAANIDADAAEASPAVASGVGVQVGAYSSRSGANAGWTTLTGQTELLQGLKNRIVQGRVDGSIVYRLQAVVGDASAAERLCNALKADGVACQVKR